MRIESGPTGERRVRSTFALLLFAVFALWFGKDGWYTYQQENLEDYVSRLPPEQRAAARSGKRYATVTMDSEPAASEAVESGRPEASRDSLTALYGGPPSHESDDAWYYFGPACLIKVVLESGRPAGAEAIKPDHGEWDLLFQKILAGVLGVVAAYLLVIVVRVFRTRLVLDESGLTYNGRGPIAWEQMRRLDTTRYDKKGWLDLCHDGAAGEKRLRLDEYHIARFDDVIDEICARKDFDNPLPDEEDSDDADTEPSDGKEDADRSDD